MPDPTPADLMRQDRLRQVQRLAGGMNKTESISLLLKNRDVLHNTVIVDAIVLIMADTKPGKEFTNASLCYLLKCGTSSNLCKRLKALKKANLIEYEYNSPDTYTIWRVGPITPTTP